MQGKLVPQDPSDQPASELLKDIQAEKAKLLADANQKTKRAVTYKARRNPIQTSTRLGVGEAWLVYIRYYGGAVTRLLYIQ